MSILSYDETNGNYHHQERSFKIKFNVLDKISRYFIETLHKHIKTSRLHLMNKNLISWRLFCIFLKMSWHSKRLSCKNFYLYFTHLKIDVQKNLFMAYFECLTIIDCHFILLYHINFTQISQHQKNWPFANDDDDDHFVPLLYSLKCFFQNINNITVVLKFSMFLGGN